MELSHLSVHDMATGKRQVIPVSSTMSSYTQRGLRNHTGGVSTPVQPTFFTRSLYNNRQPAAPAQPSLARTQPIKLAEPIETEGPPAEEVDLLGSEIDIDIPVRGSSSVTIPKANKVLAEEPKAAFDPLASEIDIDIPVRPTTSSSSSSRSAAPSANIDDMIEAALESEFDAETPAVPSSSFSRQPVARVMEPASEIDIDIPERQVAPLQDMSAADLAPQTGGRRSAYWMHTGGRQVRDSGLELSEDLEREVYKYVKQHGGRIGRSDSESSFGLSSASSGRSSSVSSSVSSSRSSSSRGSRSSLSSMLSGGASSASSASSSSSSEESEAEPVKKKRPANPALAKYREYTDFIKGKLHAAGIKISGGVDLQRYAKIYKDMGVERAGDKDLAKCLPEARKIFEQELKSGQAKRRYDELMQKKGAK
jgi:hypothetical protein